MLWGINLIFSLKKINEKLSVKTKTMVLVFGIIVAICLVFLTFRYLDAKNFISQYQIFYTNYVQSVYNQNIRKTKIFYTNRGKANLNSYGISQALSNNDFYKLKNLSKKRWRVLKKENPFLTSMAFYSSNGKLLTYLGTKPLENIEKKVNGFYKSEDFIFKIFVQDKSGGYLNFNLDIRYFLDEILKSTKIIGYVKIDKQIISHSFKKEYLPFISFLKNKINHKDKIVSIGKKKFFIYTIKTNLISSKKDFQTIFFQDISAEQKRLYNSTIRSIIIVLILCLIIFFTLNIGFNVLINRLEENNKELTNSKKELNTLNLMLEHRIEEESRKRMYNEQILIHQSKLASMGEMIGNIAHQWRQPLTQLATILVGIELKYENNKLSQKTLCEDMREAEGQINFMSKTIDDFKNFFLKDKTKTKFSIKECVDNAIVLIKSSLKNNMINYEIKIIQDSEILGYKNEVSQVLLNLLANAKDILLEREIKTPFIWITISRQKEYAKITIEDNGGGIKHQLLEKIFEPYFTTKHASAGTGIGLYMSKNIIEKNSGGNLKAENTKNGALFTILLDLYN